MTKVLIFEPDHAFAVELRTQLTQLGCTVQVFKEGNTGLIAASTQPPDLILLSVELPRVNGFSICNKIKKDAKLSAIPLLIMSSSSSPETFEQHQRLPTRAEAYLHKPIGFGDLLQHMQRFARIGEVNDAPFEIVDEPTSQVGEHELEFVEEALVPSENGYHTDRMPVVAPPLPEDDIPIHEATHPTVDEPLPSTTRRATSFSQPAIADDLQPPTTPNPGSFIPQYGLDEDDDELEQTQVGSRKMVEEAAQALTAGAPVSSRPGTPVLPTPDVPLTPTALQAELAKSKRALQHALRELSAAKRAAATSARLGDDNQRLRRELDEQRQKVAAIGDTSVQSSREALGFREQLHQKDREIIELHERIAAKEREVLEARDATLASERRNADLGDLINQRDRELVDAHSRIETLGAEKAVLEESQRALLEAEKRVEALEADRELSEKRAQDFKTGARKIADQLNDRTQELRDAVEQHQTQLAELQQQHAEALKQRDEKHRAELSRAEASHQEQLARLREEARAELDTANQALAESERQREELGATSANLQEEQARELSSARDEATARITELESMLAMLESDKAKLADQLAATTKDAAEQAQRHDDALQELRQNHERALEEVRAIEHKRLNELREEHERVLTDLHAEQAEALQHAGYEMQEKLLQKEESFKGIKEQLDRDLVEAQNDADTLREHIAVLERELEQEKVASGDASQLKQTMTELEQRITELDAEVADHKRQLNEERGRADEVDEQLGTITEERDDLKQQLDGLGEQLLDLDKQLATERGRLAKARTRWGLDRQALQQAREALEKVAQQLGSAAEEELD